MNRMHPDDLKAIMSAILYSEAGYNAVPRADELLQQIGHRPDPDHSVDSNDMVQQKIRNAGFAGIDTMIQVLGFRAEAIARLESENSDLHANLEASEAQAARLAEALEGLWKWFHRRGVTPHDALVLDEAEATIAAYRKTK